MQRIEMTKPFKFAADGATVREYEKGDRLTVTDDLAKILVTDEKVAKEISANAKGGDENVGSATVPETLKGNTNKADGKAVTMPGVTDGK